MPTKGRPKLQCRVPEELLERVQVQLDSIIAHATTRTRMNLDLSGFVVAAIEEKLAKMARSRRRKKRPGGSVSFPPAERKGGTEDSSDGELSEEGQQLGQVVPDDGGFFRTH